MSHLQPRHMRSSRESCDARAPDSSERPSIAGIVAIGRNEGERLRRCLASLPGPGPVIYVDSGSKDGSPTWARDRGARVVELDDSVPFTAARARNAGYGVLRQEADAVRYVQFIDGDCELSQGWLERATQYLDQNKDVAAVCGTLKERHPDRSIYNKLCDYEWNGATGNTSAVGGIAMFRTDAFDAAGGFREDLIAGEEPELCLRLRREGWRLSRLDVAMANHDANITHIRQWWRRAVRSGYAFASGAWLHGHSSERYRIWECCRAIIWAFLLPVAIGSACVLFGVGASAALLIYPVQVLRQAFRLTGPIGDRLQRAAFQLLSRFAELVGIAKFLGHALAKHRASLIEYK